MPDYYGILGVARDAGADDIKRAYRKLARESHPDANQHDPQAEERFKQVSEAYEVLSDPQKRQRYDTYGDANAQGAPFGAGFGDLGDIMEAFFGGSPFGGGGRQRTRTRSPGVPGQDIGLTEVLTLEEAVFGTERTVTLDVLGVCERCDGAGTEPGTFRGRCPQCAGQGEIRATRQTILGTVVTARPCPSCNGAGEAPTDPCTACQGHGRVRSRKEVTIEIPQGVHDGTTLRLRGRGESGVRGGPDGDLFVGVRVQPHELFQRDGDDLVCELVVPLTQAVLGAELPIQTLDGEQTVRVPAGTQHDAVLRLKGFGAGRLDGRSRGDLRVHVAIEVPTHLNAEQRALFEQIADLRGESVTGEQKGLFRRMRDTILGE